ncbi:hypothetical protein HPA16_03070 [Streptococcus suis]|nr:hypothetical protein [Streptococcus suis]
MNKLLTEIFKILPDWARIIIAVVTLIAILIVFAMIIYTIWKYANAVDKESKVFDLSKQNQELLEENRKIKYFNNFLETYFELLEEILPTLEVQVESIFDVWDDEISQEDKRVRVNEVHNIFNNSIQRYIDVMTSEFTSTNKCRISVWYCPSEEENILKILARSSTFLRTSSRKLNIDNSIAGRAFRKGKKQFSKSLDVDPDWEKYLQDSRYQSISAFPIDGNRVVSIDYKFVPTELDDKLSELIVSGLDNIFSRIAKVSIYLDIIEKEIADES